jgi:hypothetical protein
MRDPDRLVLCMPKCRDGEAIRRAWKAFDADVGILVNE